MTWSAERPGSDGGDGGDAGQQRDEGLHALLTHFTVGDQDEVLRMRDLLARLQQSGFGAFLFVVVLPAFIPIPGAAGAVSGPLTILIGLQMLLGLRRPWLPEFIGNRGPRRSTTRRFIERISRLLGWLDRMLRPRWLLLLRPLPAHAFSGLQLVLLGILLSLPIPFTNYLFGVLLLLFSLALLERDGRLMAACWVLGAVCIAVFGLASGQLLDLVSGLTRHGPG